MSDYRRRPILCLLKLLAFLVGLSSLVLAGIPFLFFPLAFVALVPLLWLWENSSGSGRAFLWAFSAGVIFYLFHLHWIPNMLTDVPVPRWLLWVGMSLLVLYQASWWGLAGIIARWLRGAPAWVMAPGFSACWVLLEYIRCHMGDLSFTWATLWAPALGDPLLMSTAAFWGPFGVSLAIALVNALAYRVARDRAWRSLLWALGTVVAVHLVGLLPNGTRRVGTLRVAVIQPNLLLESWQAVIEAYTSLAKGISSERVRLVVLPESAFPGPLRYSGRARELAMLVSGEAGGVPLVMASWDKEDKRYYNTVFLLDSAGRPLDRYDKVILVPFGEHYPFQEHLPDPLRKIDIGVGNYSRGDRIKPLAVDSVFLGPYICYESLFPDVARAQALSGAHVLLNLTNDGWFGTSLGPIEHFHLGRFRAAETGRFIIRAGKTGISAVIDDRGRIVRKTGLFEKGLIIADVPLFEGLTPYAIAGDWPAILSALILALALGYTLIAHKKKKGR